MHSDRDRETEGYDEGEAMPETDKPSGGRVYHELKGSPEKDTSDDCCGRMSAKNSLKQLIRRKRSEVAQLQALLDELPGKLSPPADEALWSLIVNSK
jgi:hypothetical protein